MNEIPLLAAAAGTNLVIGVVFTLIVYATLERAPAAAGAAGFGLGAGVVYAQKYIGESVLSVGMPEMKLLIVAAVLGGLAGIIGTTTLIKPSTN